MSESADYQNDTSDDDDVLQLWPQDKFGPIMYANAFATQFNAERLEVFLYIGSLDIPLPSQPGQTSPVSISPIARIAITPIKAVELANVLMQTAQQLNVETGQLVADAEAEMAEQSDED